MNGGKASPGGRMIKGEKQVDILAVKSSEKHNMQARLIRFASFVKHQLIHVQRGGL